MAAVVEGHTRADLGWSSADFTVTEPTGTSEGDVLLLICAVDHVGSRDVTESGGSDWTEIFDLQASTYAHMWAFICERGASAPNLTFSRDSGWMSWAVYRISGADATSYGYTTDEDGSGKTVYTPGQLANSRDAAIISTIIAGNQSGSVSGSGYDSEDFDDNVFSNYLFAGYHDDSSVAGDYSPGSMTLSSSWVAQAASIYVNPPLDSIAWAGTGTAEDENNTIDTPTTAITFTSPPTWVDGDLGLFICNADGTCDLSTYPSGWTEAVDYEPAAFTSRNRLFVATADVASAASPPGTVFTFTPGSDNRDAMLQMVRLTGVDNSTPFDVTYSEGSHANDGNNASPSWNSITTNTDGALVIAIVGYRRADRPITGSAPTGWKLEFEEIGAAGGRILAVYTMTQATAGTVSGETISLTASGRWSTVVLALEPAATSTPVTVNASTIAATSTVPAVTVTVDESVAAATIAAVAAVPAVTVTIDDGSWPPVIAAVATMPAVTVTTTGAAVVNASTIAAVATTPAVTVTNGAGVTVAAGVVAAAATTPAVTVTAGTGVTVTAGTIATTAAMPAVTIVLSVDVTVSASVIAAVATCPELTVFVGAGTSVSPPTVACSTTFGLDIATRMILEADLPAALLNVEPYHVTNIERRWKSRFATARRGKNIFILTDDTITTRYPINPSTISRQILAGHESPTDLSSEEITLLVDAGYSFEVR